MCSSYLLVTFYFILYKGSNKYLATCQKQFFCYFTKNIYVFGVVFTSGGQGHFGFYEKGGEGQEEEEGEMQLRRSDAALIALKNDFAPQATLGNDGDIFGCHN